MADAHRITKDTSARKNDKPPGMHTAREMNAVKASHEAYLSATIKGYDEQIEAMEQEHNREIFELKAAHHAMQVDAEGRQKAFADEAVRKALAGSQAQIEGLRGIISKLESKEKDFQAILDKKDTAVQAAKEEANGLLSVKINRIKNLEIAASNTNMAHVKEVQALRQQLRTGPNAWVMFHIKGKGLKKKTYWKRPTAQFREATKDHREKRGDAITGFRHKTQVIQPLSKMTLEELNIKNDDELIAVEQ